MVQQLGLGIKVGQASSAYTCVGTPYRRAVWTRYNAPFASHTFLHIAVGCARQMRPASLLYWWGALVSALCALRNGGGGRDAEGGDGMATTMIALLRGVNVGGQRMVKMAELKRVFVEMGFGSAQTYIQSGNVLFSAEGAEGELRERIERELEAAFGFAVTVVIRTVAEMERLRAATPFAVEGLAAGEELYVALLAETPEPGRIAKLVTRVSGTDECRVVGREVYILYRQSAHTSLFSNAFVERCLGVAATTRNWRTLGTLLTMAQAMEA